MASSTPTGEEIWGRLQKTGKKPKADPKPIAKVGKVSKARQADRRAKLKAEPADYRGMRQCYLCQQWFVNVDLEHVIDASVRPDLRHEPSNHKWACNPCNLEKKRSLKKPRT